MPFIKHIPPKGRPQCMSPEHNPPSMMVLEPGVHIWACPACNDTQTVYGQEVTL